MLLFRGIVMAFAALVAACCIFQVITGRELIRLSPQKRPPARVRLEYIGPSTMGIGAVLTCIGMSYVWWGQALTWAGLIWTMATSTRSRRRT